MSIPFSYHVRIAAQRVGKIHGPIDTLVIMVSLQWSQKGNSNLVLLEVSALITLLLLHIQLKLIRTYRKGYHFWRKVWHALLHTVTICYSWMFHLRCLHLKHFLSCSQLYHLQRTFELFCHRRWQIQGICLSSFYFN